MELDFRVIAPTSKFGQNVGQIEIHDSKTRYCQTPDLNKSKALEKTWLRTLFGSCLLVVGCCNAGLTLMLLWHLKMPIAQVNTPFSREEVDDTDNTDDADITDDKNDSYDTDDTDDTVDTDDTDDKGQWNNGVMAGTGWNG